MGAATDHLGRSYALGGATQLASSTPSDYYAVTLGLNWKPARMMNLADTRLKRLNIRPNFRYDVADALHGTYRPFGGNNDQVVMSLDAVLPF